MEMVLTLGRLRHRLPLIRLVSVFELIDANTTGIVYSLFIRYVIVFDGFEVPFDVLEDSLLSGFLVSHSLIAPVLL